MNDILILSRNGNTVKLFCNFYYEGKEILYFSNDADTVELESIKIEEPEIVLANLDFTTYYFSSRDDMVDSVSIPIISEEKENLIDTYLQYLAITDKEEKVKAACKINRLICSHEIWADYHDYEPDIKIKKSNTVNIEILMPELLRQGKLLLEIEKLDVADNKFKTENILRISDVMTRLPLKDESLYQLSVYSNDGLVRRFTVFTEKNYSETNFELELNNKLSVEEKTELSSYFLPPDYKYSSEKEKNIILNLNYFNTLPAVLFRPILELDGYTVKCTIGNDYGLFKMEQLYLCGIEEDQIYNPSVSARLIPVTSDTFKFDTREYFFNREPYYFFFADQDGIMISPVTYMDFSADNYDKEDYNLIYQKIFLDNYILRLHRTFDFFLPDVWPKIRAILDAFHAKQDIECEDITDYVISHICRELSSREYNKMLAIFYTEFCRHKYYFTKSNDFVLKQRCEKLTKTHFIEKGDYICKVMQISPDGEISYSYYDGREAGVYLRIDKAQYTLFWCISTDSFLVNNYNMYYLNSDKKVEYRLLDKNIEVNDGQIY